MGILLGLIFFIVLVFPLIIIHEFGHFLVGKVLGAKPTEFSIGFGQALGSFRWLGATFKIGWIPLGGYVRFSTVQFTGENPQAEKLPAWKWIPIALAGPLTNLLFTFVLFTGFVFLLLSSVQSQTIIKSTNPTYQSGKVLTFQQSSFQPILTKMFTNTNATQVLVTDSASIPLTPELAMTLELSSNKAMPLGQRIQGSLWAGTKIIGVLFKETTLALVRLVSTEKGYKELSGPVGIASEAKRSAEDGALAFLFLMASVSFALAYFNLLPLAFLDGGRALLALYEVLSRRPLSVATLSTFNILGLLLFLNLIAVALFSDFTRLLGK